MSLPEALLWQRLRGSQGGVKLRRQHPIGPYVADFYCAQARTVIEVDGEAHDRGDSPRRDIGRDRYLEAKDYHILRILASDVLTDPDRIASSIVAALKNPLHQPSAGPPPRAGEDHDA